MISYSCMRVDVVRLGVNGEGIFYVPVGKNKDKIGFVDFVLPGESADIEITQDKSKFCRAKLIDLCSKSANRVVPKCKYFGVCGGCDLQHMDKLLQTEFKKKLILDVVQKFGYSSDIEIVCGEPLGYRNKMVFPFDCSKDKITLGMFKKNSHEVVDIDECLIAKSGINKVLDFCKKYFDTNNKLFEKCKNELKYLVVREVEHKFLITLVCGRKIDLSDFCDSICNAFDVLGVYMNISDNSDDILSGDNTLIAGVGQIDLCEFGIDYSIDNLSFLQVNDEMKTKVYDTVINYASGDIVDAYSGAGLLSGIMARSNRKVVGIEINKNASHCADILKEKNNLKSLKNICGDTGVYLPKVSKDFDWYTLILDPARSGCGKAVLDFLKDKSANLPASIVYVSCNLATLKRDLAQICQNYKITYVRGVDMFPNTKHIETIVCLQKQV